MVICLTVWISEFFKGFFIITLINNIGGIEPWWSYVLSECSCLRFVFQKLSPSNTQLANYNTWGQWYLLVTLTY